jgi:hypothetical protein
MDNVWGKVLNWHNRSWEEILTPEERLGGPSPWGSSRWAAFKKCPFYYQARYIRHMEPVEKSEALEIGGLYHEARARYHQGYLDELSDDEAIQAGYDIVSRAEKVTPAYAATVRRMFKGWLVHSGPGTPNDHRKDTGGVEQLIEYYDGAFPYSTRIDLWNHIEGGVEIVEIKTAGRRTGQLLSSYKMDSQFLGQMYLWKKVMEPQGYPPLRRYTIDLAVKTNPPQYSREIAPVDNRIIADWEHEMQEHWRDLQYYTKSAKRWPKRRSYHTCFWCNLFSYCATNGKNRAGWRFKKK